KLIGGYRFDKWSAQDERDRIGLLGMMNPTAGETRNDSLNSGFIRYEQRLDNRPVTLYAGFGHSARFPDYWEMIAKEGKNTSSAFEIKAEKTDQIDTGFLYKSQRWELSTSLFYNQITDFILVDYSDSMKMNGVSRNIDATTYGGELVASYRLTSRMKLDSSLATTWGSNDTDKDGACANSPRRSAHGIKLRHPSLVCWWPAENGDSAKTL
ncbi:MAG TPA: TonB-dependent receptor, partial [Pseudomonadales bacterium]|nr:TonB-dependent receptor [Pseudomonadales bacterium]